MPTPKVTIIVLNWNGRELTLKCLRSLDKLRYEGVTILVVDNGSQDGSAAAIRDQFPNVKLLPLTQNLGYALGNNAGLEAALKEEPQWIMFLNNDTEVAPDLLTELIRGTEGYPEGGVFGPKIYYHGPGDIIWYAGGEVDLRLGRLRHRGIRQHDRGQYDEPGRTDFVSGCCLLIRADLAGELAGFDPAYTMYVEDADLCYRARRLQAGCYYLPAGKVWHAVSSSMGGVLSLRRVGHKFISSMRFLGRYARSWYWPSILAYQVVYYGLLGPVIYARQRWGAP